MKPLAIDLYCGLRFGWTRGLVAEGWRVIGYGIADVVDYPGEFRRRDVRSVNGSDFERPALILASPPCEQFTRHQLPWLKRLNPPEPDLSLVESAWRIAREAQAPIVLENVRKAQSWLGKARAHYGSRYLWGDVPALLPFAEKSRKEHLSSTAIAERAEIPFELARYIASVFKPR